MSRRRRTPTAGRVWGGIQGQYAFTMATLAPTTADTPTIFFFTGKSVVTLKSGDVVNGTDTGSIDVAAGGFASLITFKASDGSPLGQIRLRGDFDPVAGDNERRLSRYALHALTRSLLLFLSPFAS